MGPVADPPRRGGSNSGRRLTPRPLEPGQRRRRFERPLAAPMPTESASEAELPYPEPRRTDPVDARVAAQKSGKAIPSTPLERMEMLCDAGSLRVLRSGVSPVAARRSIPGDGALAATGTVEGRPITCYAQDASFLGGSLGSAHAETIVKAQKLARESGIPAVGLVESGGARMDEGVGALNGYGQIFAEHVAASGWVPQISVICGTSAGGGCYSPALTDLIVMCESATMFLTGPKVVEEVIGESVSITELGGPEVHRETGVCQLVATDPGDAVRSTRRFLSYLPSNSSEPPPLRAPESPAFDDPGAFVPLERRKVYDVGLVADAIADAGSVFELAPAWAPNLFVSFARIEGRPVGIIANQPRHLAGVLDSAAAEKGAWFVNLCNDYNVPLLTLVDTPGFMPGTLEEGRGVIRLGAKLVRAFAAATVPKLTVVLRKAFGGAYITMNSLGLGADVAFAWPSAEIGVMAPTQAVGIVNRRALAEADDFEAERERLAEIYAREHTGPDAAAGGGWIDEVIEPRDTRDRVAEFLSLRTDNTIRRRA